MKRGCVVFLLTVLLVAACTVSQAPDSAVTEIAQSAPTATAVPATAEPTPTAAPTVTATAVPTPTMTPTPLPPDPEEILSAVADAQWDARTFRCRTEINARMSMDGMILPFDMTYDMQVKLPEGSKGRFEGRVFGETLQQDLIVIGDITYYREEGSAVWMVDAGQEVASLELDPDATLLDMLVKLEFVGQEALDGRDVYHIRGENKVLAKQFKNLFGDFGFEYEDTEPVMTDLWIGVDDSLLYKTLSLARLTAMLPEIDTADTEMTLDITSEDTYADYGRRVTLAAPETPTGTLVFTSNRSGTDELYLVNADGSGLQRLTLDGWVKSGPAWSPDGEHIVFAATNVNNDIYSIQLANGVVTQLTDTPFDEAFPVWSPDGTQMAIESNQTGDWDIYLFNVTEGAAAGGVTSNITRHSAPHDIYPAWSPDGTQIAFGSDRDVFESIYVMNADGSSVTRLTDDPTRSDGYPTWSPHGTRIAFSAFTSAGEAGADLFVMNADGSALTRLTDHPANDMFPSWSPDGTRIAFSSDRAGDFDIYVLYLDNMEIIQLTTDAAAEGFPAWKPCGETCEPLQSAQLTFSKTAGR